MKSTRFYYCLLFVFALGCSDKPENHFSQEVPEPTPAISFDSVFTVTKSITLDGNMDIPMASAYKISLTPNEIVLHDYDNFMLRVFDRDGEFLQSVGSEGEGPGEFGSVSGVFTDPAGNHYVNDQIQRRVQRFSPDWNYNGTMPAKTGNGASAVPVTLENDVQFIITGRTPVDPSQNPNDVTDYNLLTLYDFETGTKRNFALDYKRSSTSAWQVEVDIVSEKIYLANMAANMIDVYSLAGDSLDTITLSDANIVPLVVPNRVHRKMTEQEWEENVAFMKEAAFTTIRHVFLYDNQLYIDVSRRKFPENLAETFLEIYTLEGELVKGNITLSGSLQHIDENGIFYFLEAENKDDYTNGIVTMAMLKHLNND